MTTESEDNEAIRLELELRNIYYNPATGYQSAEKLYQKAKLEGLEGVKGEVTRKEVKNWLHSQKTYTKHFPKNAVKRYQRTYVKNLADQMQMDLVDMRKYGPQNQGPDGVETKWILTGVEILSRFAFALPVNRKDAKHMAPAVLKMINNFKSHFGKYPDYVQFDNGSEFYNSGVKTMLRENNIDYFSSRVFRKAAIVERFNRTLKNKMWKFFTHEGNQEWIYALPEFISGYNDTVNRGIKMKPNEVNRENQDQVHLTLYGLPPHVLPKPKYTLGDTVRIPVINRKRYDIADKGFTQGFTDEIFVVSAVYRGVPVMYNVKTQGEALPVEEGRDKRKKVAVGPGEILLGKYYEWELVKVTKGGGEQE